MSSGDGVTPPGDPEHAPERAREPQPKAHVPPSVAIRAPAPKPKRLSRKTLMAGALVIGAVVAFALLSGLSERERTSGAETREQIVQPANPPESVRIARAEYGDSDLRPPTNEGEDYFWGDHAPPGEELTAADHDVEQVAASPRPSPVEAEAEQARISAIAFGGGSRRPGAAGEADAIAPDRRSAFLASQRGAGDGVLDAEYRPPRSPYAIQAGSTISAALITALNSDQPGRVVAQVSENVFDSVTGAHLLIPQGARLLGAYDADNAYGDQRLLVVWNRLIMPNGWSLPLRGMPGTDATGQSGLRDQVDNHVGRIAVASLLSGVLSVSANEVEDDDSDRFAASVGDAAAQEAARVGARIVNRELNVRPTLRIRAGAPVRVLVSQDIVLRPYPR
jgi:type IV secretion system protein VirB10